MEKLFPTEQKNNNKYRNNSHQKPNFKKRLKQIGK